MKLGDIIKKYREEHDLSQRQFAKLCGLSHGYVPLIEKGLNPNGYPLTPSITVMKQLADAMGMTLHELISLSDDDMEIDLSPENNIPSPTPPLETFTLTPHEITLVEAYRANPAMQPAVNRLLNIPDEVPNGT